MLCENEWNGGAGYTPNEVGNMTPDQIYFRLIDKGILKKTDRFVKTETAGLPVNKEGKVKVRLSDGTAVYKDLRSRLKKQRGN